MAYSGAVANRPAGLTGALQTFSETTDEAALVRSRMDDAQTIKVRRRVTVPIRQGSASVTVKAEEVALWRTWFNDNCQGGVLPTRFKFPPNCSEQIWRFASPLTFDWIDRTACRIAFALEKLPQWEDA